MKTILLIEPNMLLARTYQQAIEAAGITVMTATGAQMAIDLADDRCPDLVILELDLAAHDGIEFLHEFASYSEWQNVPIIINTLALPRNLAPMEAALKTRYGVRQIFYKSQTDLKQLVREVREQLA